LETACATLSIRASIGCKEDAVVRFLARRIALGLFVLWLVTVLVFGMFFTGGGAASVARRLAGKQATPQTLELIRKRLLLNEPIYAQYWHFLSGILHGNLGYSYIHGQPVTTVIKQALPITLSLLLGASAIWLVSGILSGVLSAVRRGSVWDRMTTGTALFFYSMPVFVLGLLLQFIFYFEFTIHGIRIFPAPGYTPFTTSPSLWFRGLLLPWITLALVSAAVYTRLTRGSMLDVLGEDYIRTARAKGLAERRVVYRHALRSALTPVVSQFGIDVGTVIGGAILVETVFGMPGLGYTAVVSIEQQDLPVIIGIVIVAAAMVVAANISVDVLYAVLDPRVRLR
jgi:peptide/nickel transport system permease protein